MKYVRINTYGEVLIPESCFSHLGEILVIKREYDKEKTLFYRKCKGGVEYQVVDEKDILLSKDETPAADYRLGEE